ncbi:hypothetical protein Plhal304r1_c017g0062211 [Plasmopara halstedii]
MFVPVLSTLLLLEFSVSSTTNSIIIHDEDQVVFVGHLNDSMLSANTTPSVANGELERSNDSKQVIDETIGEVRISPLFGKGSLFAKWFAKERPVEWRVETASNLMKISPRKRKQNEKVSHQVKKLFESDDGTSALFAEVKVSKLLKDGATSELTVQRLLNSETKLSALFSILMKETKDGSLDEFFQRELHVPLLSYALALYQKVPFDMEIIATDVARLLTEYRKEGTLITWLETYQIPSSKANRVPSSSFVNIFPLVNGLSRHKKTLVLAYRLHSLTSDNFPDFRLYYHYDIQLSERKFWFNFAAFARFNYIEHEARSFEFMNSAVKNYLSTYLRVLESEHLATLQGYLKELSKVGATKDDQHEWLQIGDDHTRLFKAALQSEDNTNYVRGALTTYRRIAEFNEKLIDVKLVKSFKQLLRKEARVESLQKMIQDKILVEYFLNNVGSANDLENFESFLKISGQSMEDEQKEIIQQLQLLLTDEDTFLLKTALNDDHRDLRAKQYGN